ncbi:MAG: hypothetical protein M3198_08830, partial [Actinomycetota bacterium]|nr:hypothetical protein [Actinomycetota bacterium]
ARVLLGPLSVIFMSAMSFTISEAARMREEGDPRVLMIVRGAGVLMAAITVAWGLVLAILPVGVGTLLLGDTFPGARQALPGLALYWAMFGIIVAARAGLKAAQAAKTCLLIVAILAPITLLGGIMGAATGGATGAAWGLGIVNAFGAALWWIGLRSRQQDLLGDVSEHAA